MRLVQRCVAICELRKRRRLRLLRGGCQTVHVQAREVIWSVDAMQAGREDDGGAILAEVLSDVGGARTIAMRICTSALGEDVIAQLESASAVRGALPLVLSSDNGSAYVSDVVERYLEENHVPHLRSVPRTPQHNAWAERGIGEVRQESGLRSQTRLGGGPEEATLRLSAAWAKLDHERYRTRFQSTAATRDNALPRGYHGTDREVLYRIARERAKEVTLCHELRRDQRRAQREAIFLTLENFKLIDRTRGDGQRGTRKAEIVS